MIPRSRNIIAHTVILVPTEHPFSRRCDHCSKNTSQIYFDAATLSGRWEFLCPECFWSFGRALGLGLGQLYIRVDSAEVQSPLKG
jgi:hypothetical protein